MKIIKIEETKKEKMSEYVEKLLKYGGKLMQVIEDLGEGSMGNRDDDDDDDDDFDMREGMRGGYRENMGNRYGERRSRITGRYIR